MKRTPLKLGPLVMALLLLSTSVCSQTDGPAPIADAKHYWLSSYHVYSGSNLDWQTVAKQPTTSESLRKGRFTQQQPAWIRLDLQTESLTTDRWLLDLGTLFGGVFSVYVVTEGQLIEEYHIDSYQSFDTRPYPYRNVLIPLALEQNTKTQVLIDVKNLGTYSFFNFSTYPEEPFIISDRRMTWLLGIQIGLMVALAIYHFMLAGATLDKVYWIYSFYIVANVLYTLVTTGYGFQYLWPNIAWMQYQLGPMAGVLPTVFAIPFAISFLRLPKIAPRLTYVFYVLLAGLIVGTLARHIGFSALAPFITYLFYITYTLFIVAGIYALKKDVVYARFFLIAWTVHCIALINFMLAQTSYGLFPMQARNIMTFGFDAQVFLLSLAIAHRIRSMRDAKREAEADNKAKSVFLARMSHEIRTPLSGILGVSELMADRLQDKTDLHYNEIIRSSGKSLLTVINDILDYSKFTSGDIDLEKIPFSMQRLAVDSLDVFRIKAAEKNIELIADIDPEMPEFLEGDPTRVKQVILNLVGNAIKFTEEGQIVLSVNYADKDNDMVKIKITDSGPGIPADNQDKLFNAFSQADNSTARKYGGTGLGLTICKELAGLMGGTIGVESELGKGSAFWITAHLPASQERRAIVNLEDINLKGLRLLIVEDNFTFSNLLLTQAESWGMEATVAHNGEQALEILRTCHDEGLEFDLISLDLFMPKMDGLEASRHMQLDYRFNKIPRLLLTSSTNFPSNEQLKSAGINRVLEKPTLPAELKDIYKQLLAGIKAQTTEQLPDVVVPDPISPLRILVAEDNKVNQTVIRGILKRFNQNPDIVDDGQDAVTALTELNKIYDLILMDCEMVNMDGLEATRLIRQWETDSECSPVKIMALTAHVLPEQVDSCYEAGMDGYLTKPIDISKIEELLRSFPTDKPSDTTYVAKSG